MANEIGNEYMTLVDWAKRTKPGGGIDQIIEVLAASNPIIADANVMEGNLPTGHRSTQRTSLPTGHWRMLNKGVPAEKSTTKQVDDTCGMLEAFSQVDVDLAKLNGDERVFRASEDDAFIIGLNKTAATSLFYGNQGIDPKQMHGLAPRYNSLAPTGEYYNQPITAAGAGADNTSIWMVTWGPKTCSLIFPKGSKAGLTSEDLGKQLVLDDEGNKYLAYVTRYQWNLGLALLDYRYCIRICNIDVSELTEDATTGAKLLSLMLDAYYARPTGNLGNMAKTFFYCNATIAKFLHKQAQNKSNVNLSIDNPAGEPIVRFLTAPVHICDNLLSSEAAVVA
jgi:hypothetical protein